MSRFKVKASTSQEFTPRALPEEGSHPAAVVCLVDLGTHVVDYADSGVKSHQKLYVVWELLDVPADDQGAYLIGKEYNLSGNKRAPLRQDMEVILKKTYAEDGSDMDPEELLGTVCKVDIKHNPAKTKEGKDVVYANFNGVGVLRDAEIKALGGSAEPQTIPWMFVIGEDDYETAKGALASLPRSYGKTVPMMIELSEEYKNGDLSGGFPDGQQQPKAQQQQQRPAPVRTPGRTPEVAPQQPPPGRTAGPLQPVKAAQPRAQVAAPAPARQQKPAATPPRPRPPVAAPPVTQPGGEEDDPNIPF